MTVAIDEIVFAVTLLAAIFLLLFLGYLVLDDLALFVEGQRFETCLFDLVVEIDKIGTGFPDAAQLWIQRKCIVQRAGGVGGKTVWIWVGRFVNYKLCVLFGLLSIT